MLSKSPKHILKSSLNLSRRLYIPPNHSVKCFQILLVVTSEKYFRSLMYMYITNVHVYLYRKIYYVFLPHMRLDFGSLDCGSI